MGLGLLPNLRLCLLKPYTVAALGTYIAAYRGIVLVFEFDIVLLHRLFGIDIIRRFQIPQIAVGHVNHGIRTGYTICHLSPPPFP